MNDTIYVTGTDGYHEEAPLDEISDNNLYELTPIERLIIHNWRSYDHSVGEMFAAVIGSGSGGVLNKQRNRVAEILGYESSDELPKGKDMKARREEIEGIVYQLAIEYMGIKKAPILKDFLRESERKKYDRALGDLKAQFNIQVNKLVATKLEAEVLRRLPDEEARYISQMKEAIESAKDIWHGMPHLKAIYDAFQPYLENDKAMLMALHPDRAPPERKAEFDNAFHIFNKVRETLSKINATHRKLLEHIWPIKK